MMQASSLDIHAASAAFDCMAQTYDGTFTESAIGRAQRNVVWDALQKAFRPGDRVLELNCGTGEDALFLTKRGISVLGCDASARMIEVAERRKSMEAPGSSLEFRVLRNEDVDTLTPPTPFDGVVSNFSGLNCVADPSQVVRKLTHLVKPGATALICISTRICLWETLARLGEITVPVWYPTIPAMRRAFAPWFRLRSFRAVGLFVPPSYVEPWLRNHKPVLARLEAMDRIFAGWPVLRGVGDHVLLEFERTG